MQRERDALTCACAARSQRLVAAMLMPAEAIAVAPFFPPETPARPVVDVLHGVTLTDRYRWLEDGKDRRSVGMDARAARGDAALPRSQCAAGARHEGRARRATSTATRPIRRSSSTGANSSSARGAASRRRSSTPALERPRGAAVRPGRARSVRQDEDRRRRSQSRRVAASRSASTRRAPSARISGSSTARPARRSARPITGSRQLRVGARRALRVHHAAHGGIRREAGADALPAAPAGRRPRRRRAAARGHGREGLMRGLRAGGGATSPCSRPATSGRTRSASGRSARPPRRRRSTRATSTAPKAIFRRDRDLFPHERPRAELEADGRLLREAGVRRLGDADPRAVRTCSSDVTATSAWIVATMREDVLSKLVVYDQAGKAVARSRPCRSSATSSAIAYDVDADRGYATLASFTAPYKVLRPRTARRSTGRSCGRTIRRSTCRRSSRSASTSRRATARRSPCSSCTARTWSATAPTRRCSACYGGFNVGVEPFYLGSYAAFVNRGGVFVDAGVRGGDEYGEAWHEQAMLGRKQNDVRRHDRRRRMARRREATRNRRSSRSKAAATAA